MDEYIIVQATVLAGSSIDTRNLTYQVNKYLQDGYVVSGGMTTQTVSNGCVLFQSMTKKTSQGGGGTKRRRSCKNVQ